MNKKYLKNKILLILFLILLISVTIPVFADVGNYNRYDSSSDSDYGYSDGGGDYSGIVYLILQLLRVIGIVPTIVILIIVIAIYLHYDKRNSEPRNIRLNNNLHTNPIPYNYSVDEILKVDSNFSEEKFKGWVGEVFIKLQQAWTDRNWKKVRPFESNELFNQHKAQIDEFIKLNKINVVERIAVNSIKPINYKVENGRDIMTVELVATMKDYIIDATTKKLIEGNSNKDWTMKYNLVFERKSGVKTHNSTSNKSTTNCPNCGAPTEVTTAGQCEYCGSIITTGDHDWVLTNISSFK